MQWSLLHTNHPQNLLFSFAMERTTAGLFLAPNSSFVFLHNAWAGLDGNSHAQTTPPIWGKESLNKKYRKSFQAPQRLSKMRPPIGLCSLLKHQQKNSSSLLPKTWNLFSHWFLLVPSLSSQCRSRAGWLPPNAHTHCKTCTVKYLRNNSSRAPALSSYFTPLKPIKLPHIFTNLSSSLWTLC